jgi:hypothetical protein
MSKIGKFSPDDVVKAFRDAARQSGCQNSEQRFQELLVIGRHKPPKAAAGAQGIMMELNCPSGPVIQVYRMTLHAKPG